MGYCGVGVRGVVALRVIELSDNELYNPAGAITNMLKIYLHIGHFKFLGLSRTQ